MMQADPTTQTAVIVIAAALAFQTVLLTGAFVAAWLGWRQMQVGLDTRWRALEARVDDAASHARQAADSVSRLSDRTSAVMSDASDVVRSVASVVAAPKTLLVAGAAAAARGLVSRWRRRRAASAF